MPHSLTAQEASATRLPPLRPAGRAMVDPTGRSVLLRGCNLGNWLLLEPWMMGLRGPFRDQHAIFTGLEERFGRTKAEELLDLYRRNWIGPREFEILRSFGFNLVRVPFHHSLLATEENPFTLRDDAFEWLDRAVELAEAAGVYVILDMHGAPGGQSHDMPTGHAGQNRLLTDETCQQRTAWLWQRIAERYRDRTTVIAYDLLNEPWGDFKSNIDEPLVAVMERIYREIREVDPDKLILLAGSLRGIGCYGEPTARGWRNVGFTEHFYPGLFGQGAPTLETHARFLAYDLAGKRSELEKLNGPYLVGEFNVVHESAARPEVMRRYFDFFAEAGWMATMWSVRVHRASPDPRPANWPILTNAEPLAMPDFRVASEEDIREAFERLGAVPLAVDERLRDALTASDPPALPLARFEMPPMPSASTLAGEWQATAIGLAGPAAARMSRDRRLAVWASGGDIFDRADKCQFIHQPAPATLRLGAVLEDFRTPSAYAKAGCMLRASLAPDAAHASVLVWPDGRIMACWRSEAGGETIERCLSVAPLPAGFGLERTEGEIRAVYPAGDGQLRTWIFPHVAALADGGVGGWAVSAQRETAAAYAEFSSLVFTNGSWPGAGGDRQFPNLLDNGGFDEQAEKPTTARGWEHVGPALPREADRETSLGEAHIRFDPRQRRDRQPAALAQAIASLTPGQRYVFSIAVRCAEQDACGDDELELRIEAPRGQRILHVATRKWRVRDLPPGQWNRIFVAGTAPSETARVVIRVEGDGGGDWLLDAAEFRVSTQYGPIRAPDAVGSVPE